MTILEAAQALRARKVSAAELTAEALGRIARDNPKLNAFITVIPDAAPAPAPAPDNALRGIPIAHKDIFPTRGIRTTAGTKIFADHVPNYDAEVVAILRDAGSIMLGKTNLHEACYGITSNNPHFGPVRNPWDTGRIPGGSSGGSAAAVASGMVFMATGTDTGGSIRVPASFCGVVGLKPTYGRVSTRGVMPLGFTLDHVGPLTRTVRDAAVSFHAMLGAHASGYVPPAHADISGLRIGVPENFFFDRLDPEVTASVRRAVQVAAGLGAHVTEIRLPDVDALNIVGRLLLTADVAAIWRRYLDRSADFGADVLAAIQQGCLIPAADYLDAQRLRGVLAREFARIWDHLDCLLAPATPITAPKIGETIVTLAGVEEDVRIASTRLVRPFNVLGWPALALPCGFSQTKLPIGLQLVAAPRQEDTLFQTGAALEDALHVAQAAP